MEIRRGDIFYIAKGRTVNQGCEQYPDRPAIIVSNDIGNQHSPNVEVVYLTTQPKKPLPTHVEIMCQVPSTALCEGVDTVSKERLAGYLRTCTDREMKAIDDALLISLGMDNDECNSANQFWRMITDLNAQLETERDYIKELEGELETYKSNNEIKYVIDGEKVTKLGESEEIIALQTKCELYKEQYEALLERMLGGRQVC